MTTHLSRFSWLIPLVIFLLALFLRLYALGSLPPSLYWEEVALGYDAYSILKTGRDFHGTPWPVVAFESFGDWKPSLYFYAVVPSILFFGLNEWAVRIPSAIAGLVIVVGVGLIARKLPGPIQSGFWKFCLGLGVAAISPWAILFSRGGWESNLATALIVVGVTAFMYFVDQARLQTQHFAKIRERKAVVFYLLAVVSLCASMYAYHSARIVAPLLGLGLVVVWWSQMPSEFVRRQARFLLLGAITTLVMGLPILGSLRTVETQQRFNETNMFADLALLQKSQQLQAATGNTLASKILYHRYVIYTAAVFDNYISHLTPDFLFIKGDQNLRHSVQYMGQLYHLDAIFVVLGIWWLIKQRRAWHVFLLWWLMVGILPAALTLATPHALRILTTLPVWLVIISQGIGVLISSSQQLTGRLKKRFRILNYFPLFLGAFAIALIGYGVQLTMFWRFYTVVYPQVYGGAYNDGYKQMILTVAEKAQQAPELPIVIMRSHGRPSVYYWFYTQTDPRRVQTVDATVAKDQGEYLAFENVTFPVKSEEIKSPSLVAVTVENYQILTGRALDPNDTNVTVVHDSYGRPIWVVLRY